MDNQTEQSGEGLKNTVKDDVQSIKQEFQSAKAEMADKAKEQMEAGKDQAANKLDELSDTIDQMAASISDNDKLGLAAYVHSASSCLASLATRLQEKSVDELAQEAKALAQRRPAAFLLGSVMLGFGLSRFVKASSHRELGENAYGDQPFSQRTASFEDSASAYTGNATPESPGASW
jgi:galactokinase/mevalonate kinase-like predicted kinase